MKVETIKAFFTYLTALILVTGGLWIIYATRAELAGAETRLVIAGFVGSALTFLFSAEVASRATVAATNATTAGAATMTAATAAVAAAQPTVTTTAGPPQATTIAPAVVVAPTPAQVDGVQVASEDHEP